MAKLKFFLCLIFTVRAQAQCSSEVESKKCENVCETKLFECFQNCENDIECTSTCNREHVKCENECPCHQNCPNGCPCPVSF